jgi:hypothetical protein
MFVRRCGIAAKSVPVMIRLERAFRLDAELREMQPRHLFVDDSTR